MQMGRLSPKALLDELASEPRAAGSAGDARVQKLCEQLLINAGFSVAREQFQFRTLSLFGLKRHSAGNIVATRGNPRIWLVAHSDTKSQLMPPAVRVIGAGMFLLGLALALLAFIVGISTDLEIPSYGIIAVLVIGAIPLFFNPIGNMSPGAVDNASGMAAVLLSTQALPNNLPLGVLITSAEERFMAGARNFVRMHEPAIAINCDGLDDVGKLRCWYNRGQKRFALSVAPEHAANVPPGILLDATVLAKHGWQVVTISKGSWSTLWRIHTRRDTADYLSGQSIEQAVSLITRIVLRLQPVL